jgi:hypothetical protein
MNEFAVAARNAQELLRTMLSHGIPRTLHALSTAFAALTTGSRAIPLGDNGELLRKLAIRAGEPTGMHRTC